MRISERSRALTAAAALALLSACAATTAKPLGPTPTGAAPTVRRVLDALEARNKALASFRAQARLDYHSPEQSFRSTQVVVVRAPSSARIDVMNPFGVSYTVATDGKQLTAYDRRKSIYYQGHADEVVEVLGLGDSRWAAVQAVEGGWQLVRRLGSGGILEFVVEPVALMPLRVKIYGDRDRHEVEVFYTDPRDVAGVTVPHHIEVKFKDGSHLDVDYKSMQRGVTLPEEAFRVDRPAGARFVNMDTEAGGGT